MDRVISELRSVYVIVSVKRKHVRCQVLTHFLSRYQDRLLNSIPNLQLNFIHHFCLDRHCSGLQLNVYLIPRGTEEKMKEKTRPDAINSVSFCLSVFFTIFLFA